MPPPDQGNGRAVEAEGLVHRYGSRSALDGISFRVREGELFGLLGPNGGGKTTLLKILCTLLAPTRGRAWVHGANVVDASRVVRRRIGVVFQHASLDPWLTVTENLRHQGHLHGLHGGRLADRTRKLLVELGVADRAADRVRDLSGGLRRRVELAKGLLHEPDVLLLDEPTVGLDPGGRKDFWGRLAALRAERDLTVLAATHLMDEAEMCDRIAILDLGRLVALGTPGELKGGIRGDVISLETERPDHLAREIAQRFDAESTVVDGVVRIAREDGAAFVPRLAETFPGLIRSITVGRPTLEDVFVQRTGHRFREASPGGEGPAAPGPADSGPADVDPGDSAPTDV